MARKFSKKSEKRKENEKKNGEGKKEVIYKRKLMVADAKDVAQTLP